jgi:hypothetical protein
MKREGSDFPREWDFSGIASSELRACFAYEYARELTKQWPRLLQLLAIFKHYSKLPKGHPDGWKEIRTHRLLSRIFMRRFGHSPAFWFFPDTAWQNIEDKERSELVEDLNFLWSFDEQPYRRFKIHTLGELEASNVTSIEGFAYLHELLGKEELDQTEYGFFAIDWNYVDSEIRRAFESWLNEQRKARANLGLAQIKHHKTARGGFRDKLRRLGALRVINHYQQSELADLPVKVVDDPSWKLKVPAPYSYLPDLYEAAKKAQQLLDEFRAGKRMKLVKGHSLKGHLATLRQFLYPEAQ